MKKENYFTSGIIQAVMSAISIIPDFLHFPFWLINSLIISKNVQYNNIVDTLNKHAQQIAFLMEG